MAREIKRILISTMPRSGTVFLFNFIAELFEYSKLEPSFTGGIRPNPPEWNPYIFDKTYHDLKDGQVLCAHYRLNADIQAILDQNDTLAIYLYRDPRDVAVSSALYIKYGLPNHVLHKTFREMSDADAIAFMITGGIICSEKFPADMAASPQDYINFEGMSHFIEDSRAWINDQRVVKVRYEDFVLNPLILVEAAKNSDVVIDPIRVKEVSAKWDYRTAANGREKGVEDKCSHFRKGVAGDYKNNFSEFHNALAKKYLGQWLITLGYETSIVWGGISK